jgi:regulatory protein
MAGARPARGRASAAERRAGLAERRERRAAETDPEVVLAAALRFLESRPRSVREVRRRLDQAGFPLPLVQASIDRLEELGMLDDEAFARSWVESRDRARPRGERALRSELALKGVAREVVDRILADRRPDSDASADEAAAERLLAGRARSLERITDSRVRRQRAYALLARNGFDPDVAARVSRAMASVADEAADDAADA